MNWLALGRLAATHWKASLIAVLIGGLWMAVIAGTRQSEARGRAEERARVADSTLAATKPAIARVDTLIVRDTIRVRRTIATLDTLRDTLLLHLTDTVRVKEYVRAADAAAQACSELAGDCAEFRRIAQLRFAAYETKLAAQPVAITRSCAVSNGVWALIGVGAGAIARR